MYESYKHFLEKFVSLNFIEWKIFQSKLQSVSFKKGDIIQDVGSMSNQLLFINSGLARAYIIDEDGKDYTWSIFFNDKDSKIINLFVVDYDSFCAKTPSRIAIDVIEDSEFFVLDREDVLFFYDKFKKFEKLGRLLGEDAYQYLHNLMINNRTKDAKERFQLFMQETPYLLDRVPQYQIASLLDMTPQHLSKLKKELEENPLHLDE